MKVSHVTHMTHVTIMTCMNFMTYMRPITYVICVTFMRYKISRLQTKIKRENVLGQRKCKLLPWHDGTGEYVTTNQNTTENTEQYTSER